MNHRGGLSVATLPRRSVTLVVGAVLGGLAMFVWGAVSHMALPLGSAGFRSVPADREAALLDALRGALQERALYFVPGKENSIGRDHERLGERRLVGRFVKG